MADTPRALLCECAFTDLVPEPVKAEAVQRLRDAGVDLETVPDLCELAARRDPSLKALAESGEALIIACYPRAVRWLFASSAAPLPDSARILNLRAQPPEAIPLEARESHAAAEETAEKREPGAEIANRKSQIANPKSPWLPWFPVIDRSRCNGCQQCLNFCLFGVYALGADGQVEVRNPANCKTNCPACARICPEVAIIFPKHKTSPINGAEVTPEHLAGREVRVDPRSLGQGDVYGALRRRSERAKAAAAEQITEDQAAKLCPCMMEELQKELGIPPEVLKTLPFGDIQAKLRAAREEKRTS
ncbi:MAG: ferredoxin family protein [Planctomycetes bacterium]|nr:ferredoxin family protein [Planctomycetota bacterium]